MSPPATARVASQLGRACGELIRQYPIVDWWPSRSRFEVMVGAVLVQNTRWVNVAAAIRALRARRCLTPQAIQALPAGQLQTLIRPAGCQRIKARRLRSMATRIVQLGNVRSMACLDSEALRLALLSVHGVGPETADVILCFAFDRPVFIADQYARRWLERMGFVSVREAKNYASCQRRVNELLEGAPVRYQELHAGIVLHGQARCGRSPQCSLCFLNKSCKKIYKTMI
jgi:endonuclease-3 related protein